jgi:N-acetylglucosamine-6-phosphate deacetylase
MRLGVRAALVAGEELPGDVTIEDGRVAQVGVSPAGNAGIAVPGLIDLQVNGFGGVDFLTAEAGDYAAAGVALTRCGVTAFQPTLISSPPEATRRALRAAAEAERSHRAHVRLLGVHLEGPFLSPRWAGAHPPEHLREPDVRLLDELLSAGPVSAVTLAPELPGAMELITLALARDVAVRIGHTDADAGAAHAAFDLGASAITHIHNAHRRFAPRDPGPAGAALARGDVAVTAIVDGVHLAPETVAVVRRAAGSRLSLVSDAIAAAGAGEGDFAIGGVALRIEDGRATLADGTLAGSVGTLVQALRRLVEGGASLAEAVHAASGAPALLGGRPELGRIEPGLPADIAVLDEQLQVVRTLMDGSERFSR